MKKTLFTILPLKILIPLLVISFAGCRSTNLTPEPASLTEKRTYTQPAFTPLPTQTVHIPKPESSKQPLANPRPTRTPKPVKTHPVATQSSQPAANPTTASLPAEPQRIEFATEDGVNLVGYYYPAATEVASLVILMHDIQRTQHSWVENGMVAWLQNRGGEIPTGISPLPEGVSFAVFTFDFRGMKDKGSESDLDIAEVKPGDWDKDARAALQTAAMLPGVTPFMLAIIGAHIGADSAAVACEDPNCRGAFLVSPVDYMGSKPYSDAVGYLVLIGTPITCLTGQSAPNKAGSVCLELEGADMYDIVLLPTSKFAQDLFVPEFYPQVGESIVRFLEASFHQPLSPDFY